MKTRQLIVVAFVYSALAQSTGTFTATGNMTAPRFIHTATLLPDGRVLIAGGNTTCYIGGTCLRPDHAELYDPATGTFTATGSMTTAYAASAVLLPNGKVLIAGGDITGTIGVELYDPSTGEFHGAGKPTTLKSVDSTALLNDGRVLLIGDRAELYDPISGTFSPVANWPDPATSSYWYPAVLPTGKVLLTPYEDPECELYDPATGTFNLTGALGIYYGVPRRTLLLNGAVLFTGGSTFFGNVNRAELYDPATGIFSGTGSMFSARDENHTATLLPDGTVLVTGGAGQGACVPQSACLYPPLASAEIYDPTISGFSTTGSMGSARLLHTATLLNNGQVLIAGGDAFIGGSQCCSSGTPINGLSSAELYTPAVLVPAPVLFTLSGDGKGQGAIWHAQTGQIATAGNPAVSGEALSMYTSLADGSEVPPQVIVGGRLAQLLYFGAAPGYPGYHQVNFVIPAGVPTGPAVSVRLTYIGRSSNAVTLAVQP
jgi:hypothetical protein